jgi:phospholipid/cholesterol/gamma-HCH transport system substrate-binding protein
MSNEAKVGLFVFGIIIIFIVMSMKIGELSFHKKATYSITLRFPTVEGLKVGSPLELAGVVVGKISAISLGQDYSVAVTADVNEDIMLPLDSLASIGSKGVLGDKVISLSPGISKAYLKPNGILARTEVPPSLDFLLSRLGDVASNLSDLTRSLNTSLGSEEGMTNISEMLRNFNSLSAELNNMAIDNSEGIATMIDELNNTAVNLTAFSESLADTGENISYIVASVKSGEGTVGKLFTDDTLYTSLADSVQKLQLITSKIQEENNLTLLLSDTTIYYDLVALTDNLKQVSDHVAAGDGTIGKLLTNEELYQALLEAIKNTNRAAQGIHEQTPITVMGSLLAPMIR